MENIYFLAGLPRSGASLLTAILNQNKNIYTSAESIIGDAMSVLDGLFSNSPVFVAFPKENQKNNVISSVYKNYYSNINCKNIIDRDKSWCIEGRYQLITKYISNSPKIICLYRPIIEILESYVGLFTENNSVGFVDYMMKMDEEHLDDPFNNRICHALMMEYSPLSHQINGIRYLYREHKKNVYFLNYNDLINDTDNRLSAMYKFLNIDYFNHDLDNIQKTETEDDSVYGVKNLHRVFSVIKTNNSNKNILSNEIYEQYGHMNFEDICNE